MSAPDLSDRTAIVTGAAGGLGSAMAAALLRCGAQVVLVDISTESLAESLKKLRAQFGSRVKSCLADISNPLQAAAALDQAKSLTGRLDILINNAAIGPTVLERSPKSKSLKFWESDETLWRRSVDVNINGTFLMARFAAPAMLAAGWGRIVNISTSLSTMQRAATSPYGVTKAAIEAETQIWSRDLEGTGVTVNTLLPGGAVDTDFVSAATRLAASEGKVRLLPPAVMVPPLLYLASRDSDGVSGSRFVASRWDEEKGLDAARIAADEPAFAGV